MTKMKAKESIPEFKNRQEMAEFWDTHDMADYWNELKPIKVQVSRSLSSSLNVRFDPHTLAKLRAEAKKKGIGPTTLIRMWAIEHLRTL